MMSFARYAVYYLPPEDHPLSAFGATWLGWDPAKAREVSQPDLPGIDAVTEAPRKYGFHATLKPPFRLAEGQKAEDLEDAVATFAARCAPARSDGLALTALGRFLALTPVGSSDELRRVADSAVRELDPFRAAMDDAERDRRRAAGLSDAQETLLERWGYPYVFEEFRFHMTLTGKLAKGEASIWMQHLQPRLPALPAPFLLDQVALVGECPDGRFALVRRFDLAG